MKALLQRVLRASVSVDNKIVGQCKAGWSILLGVTHSDTDEDVKKLIAKILSLRAFSDENGKMNLDIKAIQGEILLVSQFTLYADLSRGNRPGFSNSAKPDYAKELYEAFVEGLKKEKIPVETGIFGAHMEITNVCDGPVTFMLDSLV